MDNLGILSQISNYGWLPILVLALIVFVLIIFFRPQAKVFRPGKFAEKNPEVKFSGGALSKMHSFNLTEEEVLDAFYHGESKTTRKGQLMMVRRYQRYEINVLYEKRDDGKWNIFSVWKR